jgi:hypothetical protein
MMGSIWRLLVVQLLLVGTTFGFSLPSGTTTTTRNKIVSVVQGRKGLAVLRSRESNKEDTTTTTTTTAIDEDYLSQTTTGGYTVKQRLREEVDSPFRKVRLLFFGSSAGSALTALYFSALATYKAAAGGYSDAQPLDEALTSDAINIVAAIICGFLAFREYQAGESNLERIARGGKLASLVVEPAIKGERRRSLSDYRRAYRVLIAAGGEEYISKLARSLTTDELKDTNIIPEKLQETDVIVVPVLLTTTSASGAVVLSDTQDFWKNVKPIMDQDRNFDISRADSVVAFPKGQGAWAEYLQSEIETAAGQGFDVMEKGITLTVKKNGRILRRATGLPRWGDLIGTMEVMDGSRFGMPGDSERYGGP